MKTDFTHTALKFQLAKMVKLHEAAGKNKQHQGCQ